MTFFFNLATYMIEPHCTYVSSELSAQSALPSHRLLLLMQCPLAHVN